MRLCIVDGLKTLKLAWTCLLGFWAYFVRNFREWKVTVTVGCLSYTYAHSLTDGRSDRSGLFYLTQMLTDGYHRAEPHSVLEAQIELGKAGGIHKITALPGRALLEHLSPCRHEEKNGGKSFEPDAVRCPLQN